jgi:hypothetical protein
MVMAAAYLKALAVVAPMAANAAPRTTFSIDYVVTVAADNPKIARVRWELSGADEVQRFRLQFAAGRYSGLSATGKLTESADQTEIEWVPGKPYAHLSYVVRVDNLRGKQGRHDSYAASNWIIARARDLFPRIHLEYEPRGGRSVKSRARLIFRVPRGWKSVTPHQEVAEHTFALFEANKVLDRPRGWLALGMLQVTRQSVGDTMVILAQAPGSRLDAGDLIQLYEATVPSLQKLLGRVVERTLIVSAGDPMWRGGISGFSSFFIHGDRPLRTPDKTSPHLHEMFHVLQPYRAGTDADWIEEGLAEYYSLELQRRAGLIERPAFQRALEYFERYGLWRVDMTKQHDNAATNNSSPLIMHALDQRIQRATAGGKRLDDVVEALAKSPNVVDTARFKQAVEEVAGRKMGVFFTRHVTSGEPPQPR